MATSISLNGTSYSIPAASETNWSSLSAYLIAISTTTLQKNGGAFTLTSDANFGATYGLKSAYFKSTGTNISATGVVRLANLEAVSWRNIASSADLPLAVSTSDRLTFNAVNVVTISSTDTMSNKTFVAPVLGTPASGVLTNCTGTAAGLTAGNVTTNANLTGDVTSSGNATTLATVNSNVGSFGNAAKVTTVTVNAKGLITAIDVNTDIQLGSSARVTGLDTALALKAPLASPTFTGTVTLPVLVGSDATDSSSSTTGAFKTAGGLGVAKKLYVGGNFYIGSTAARNIITHFDYTEVVTGAIEKGSRLYFISNTTNNGAVGATGTAATDVWAAGRANYSFLQGASGLQFIGNVTEGGYMTAAGAWTLGNSTGTTSHLIQNNTAAGTSILAMTKHAVASNQNNTYYIDFSGSSGGNDGYIQTNGSGVLTITDTSDVRKKKNIRPASYGLNTINQLNPVEYDWIDGCANVKGFIAQEVAAVIPECVSIRDEQDRGGLVDAHYLEMQTMIPVLVKAVQELVAQNDALEARLAVLEG